MEDLDIYLYIILFVIYAVSRVFKGIKKAAPKPPVQGSPQQPQGGQPTQTAPPKRKPFSFEDLLKEFEEAATEKKSPPPVREEVAVEPPPPPPIPKVSSERSKYESYEGMSLETIPGPVEDIGKRKIGYERNKKYSLDTRSPSIYAKMLANPDGAKKAIILSEIINRKYS
jgi:hypothetical protein